MYSLAVLSWILFGCIAQTGWGVLILLILLAYFNANKIKSSDFKLYQKTFKTQLIKHALMIATLGLVLFGATYFNGHRLIVDQTLQGANLGKGK